MSATLEIEVGFDFICPWCLIGLRNLQAAMATLRGEQPQVSVKLHWRGVQLLPDVPQAGLPFQEFYRHRLGGDTAVRERQAMVLRAAQAAGARINYSVIKIMPSTADAHRLLAYAATHGSAEQRDTLLERLLRAYFEEGDDIGNPLALLAYGESVGFKRDAMMAVLRGAEQRYQADGVGNGSSGVPFYVFNGELAVTGAQPPEVLLGAMRQALAGPARTI